MDTQPALQKEPGWIRRHGCLLVLVFLVTGLVAAVLLTWFIVTKTAVPFQAAVKMVEDSYPKVKVKGIGGDIIKGPTVESITFGEDPAQPSELGGLRLKYNSVEDIHKHKRLILTDVGVSKARIDLADFPEFTKTVQSETQTASTPTPRPGAKGSPTPARSSKSAKSATPSRSRSSSSSSSGPSPLKDLGLESFEIQQMLLEDVVITNRNTGFRLSIPKIQWSGFKATQSSVEPGDLLVESDRLTLRTAPTSTPLEGNATTPKRTFTGTIQPLMHPAILKPISFQGEFALPQDQPDPWFKLRAADEKFHAERTAEGGRAFRVSHLDPGAFLDAAKFYGPDAADFPSDLSIEASEAAGDTALQIAGGSFRLGVTAFQIKPARMSEDDQAELVATARVRGVEIRWTLPFLDWPKEYRPKLSATPKLAANDILGLVFAGRKYAELTADEKQTIDSRVPAYFPQ